MKQKCKVWIRIWKALKRVYAWNTRDLNKTHVKYIVISCLKSLIWIGAKEWRLFNMNTLIFYVKSLQIYCISRLLVNVLSAYLVCLMRLVGWMSSGCDSCSKTNVLVVWKWNQIWNQNPEENSMSNIFFNYSSYTFYFIFKSPFHHTDKTHGINNISKSKWWKTQFRK